jgi:hypothetical protein
MPVAGLETWPPKRALDLPPGNVRRTCRWQSCAASAQVVAPNRCFCLSNPSRVRLRRWPGTPR